MNQRPRLRQAKSSALLYSLSIALGTIAFLLILASTARAEKATVDFIGSPGSGNGQLSTPRSVAIDQSSGELYVTDEGNSRVVVFDPSGAFLRAWGWDVDATAPGGGFEICTAASGHTCQAGQPGGAAGQFGGELTGIAFNQSTGDAYVGDYGNQRVQQFDSAGSFIRTWGWDVDAVNPSEEFEICSVAANCKTGAPGSGNGQFSRDGASFTALMALGVNSPTGDVYVTDPSNLHRSIQRFSAGGKFLGVIGSGQFPAPQSPSTLAVDSNGPESRLYSLYAQSSGVEWRGAVKFFTLEGESLGVFGPSIHSSALAVDSSHHVYINQLDELGDRRLINEYDSAGNLVERHGVGLEEPSPVSPIQSIAVNSSTGRIYAVEPDGNRVFVLDTPASLPAAEISPPTDLTATSSTLHGTVNPNGSPLSATTGYRFEYRADSSSAWSKVPVPDIDVGGGVTGVPVTETLAGLEPATTYHLRLSATRQFGAGAATSPEITFRTLAVAPVIDSVSAAAIVDTSAELRARINPRNSDTSYYFEYGPTSSYGESIPISQDGTAGSGSLPLAVFQTITGLQPGTTYHFRLRAVNDAGSMDSEDYTFTTRSVADVTQQIRGIELVSTPDKANSNPNYAGMSEDGERLSWFTTSGTPDTPLGVSPLIARRTPTSWLNTSALPAVQELIGEGNLEYRQLAVSSDLTSAVYSMADASTMTFVRVDDALGAKKHSVLASEPITDLDAQARLTVAGNADLSKVIQATRLKHDALDLNGVEDVYDISTPQPELVSRLPNGTTCGAGAAVFPEQPWGTGNYSWVSSDPKAHQQVAFRAPCNGQLYIRDIEDEVTTLVSGPIEGGGPETNAQFIRMNDDGTAVIYVTATRLDGADGNDSPDVYRWSNGTNECLTCIVPDANVKDGSTHVLASADLQTVYFKSSSQLLPTDADEGTGVYVVSEGALDYVAPWESLQEFNLSNSRRSGNVSLTPSGDVLILILHGNKPITLDPTKNQQVYRYSHSEATLDCISCLSGGMVSTQRVGSAQVSADGSTVTFITPATLLEEDINRSDDIYEWHNGRRRLVTDGMIEWPQGGTGKLDLVGMSPSGTNVFFMGAARLTGYEEDHLSQVFVARLGGGFGPPPQPPAHCVEDACQGLLDPPPQLAQSGSVTLTGPGNRAVHAQKRKRQKKKHQRRRHSVKHTTGKKG